jgi:hypothetical protein
MISTMQPESLELPSGWNCSVVMNGKPMKLHNIITEGNKTDPTIICQHGQVSIDVVQAASIAEVPLYV